MGISDWLRVFRALHERAKAGGLPAEDAEAYRAGCDELARALLAARGLAVRPGEAPRHTLRVARALQVDLESATWRARALTAELGVGGFSALLEKAPPASEELRCTMRIPGAPPLRAPIATAEVKQQPGSVRVSFAFGKLGDAERATLETLVIDTALAQIAA